MSIPKTDQFPEDPEDLTPARKRRAERGLIPEDLVEIADDIEELAQKTSPSFDFYLFSHYVCIFPNSIILDLDSTIICALDAFDK